MWRLYNMHQQTMGFMKGLGAGILAGTALAVVGGSMMKKDRNFRRRADKTIHNIGELIDDVEGIFH